MARILQRHKDLQASNGDTDTVEGRGTEEAPMPIAPDMGREHNNDNDTGTKTGDAAKSGVTWRTSISLIHNIKY